MCMRKYSLTVGLIIILFLVVIRFMLLRNDPPLYIVGHGQSMLTDPDHLTFAARNALLFDDWNPFDYNRWDVFKNSLVSGTSYLIFSLLGISRISANLTGVILNIIGIFLFVLALFKYSERTETAVTLFILLINNSLFFHGRLPFLENGLILFSGLAFFVFAKYYDRYWALGVVGALIALAALAGKLFGALLLAPVIITLFYIYRSRFVVPALVTVGGMIAAAVLYLLVFYGGSVGTLAAYYAEQTTGMYGFPPGLVSIGNFFKMLVTYGGESGLWEYIPFLTLLMSISLILLILTVPYTGEFKKENLPVIFCITWLITGVLGLMPFHHRPMRYGLYLFLPMSAVCGTAVCMMLKKKMKPALFNRWVSSVLIFFITWFTLVQIYMFFTPFGEKFKSGTGVMLPMAFAAAAVTLSIYLFLRRRRTISPGKHIGLIVGIVFLAMTVYQGQYLYRGLVYPGNYLSEYSEELGEIVDGKAVLTGPYTPTLTIDNNLKGVIYVFGLANVERNLFAKFPITHVLADRTNWSPAVEDFPFLMKAVRVVQFVVREQVVDLYRLPDTDVPPTDFEQGSVYFAERKPDSALIFFEKFADEHPGNILGKTRHIFALNAVGRIDEAVGKLDSLIDANPDNYMLHGIGSTFYQRLYESTGSPEYLRKARYHEQLTEELNPAMASSNL